ncbi:alpha/beta fold hydrolase [Amycolatopsis sp. H20-H5]|uniref:alpha/beta fold hydrolase n=1 Tax=Amycolatopsis sp. H20-H5 TaxID=3046309 RepID=UPI002DBA8600|nr:alpha/beta hydrolase [Amycolatopsis sp. H20-H5]MEC3980286.1 alpha/beta hydrolase [Amycolatopsis sp. H20-H5]
MDILKTDTGGRPVLFLHGLGATGLVWDGVTERLEGRWLAPDLPGHGGSPRLPRYSFGGLAAAVADALPETGPLVVVGHSLGGVVALALATGWFGVEVAGVLAVGVKVEWSEDDLAKAAAMATRPAKVFGSREDAERAYLKVSGLTGLTAADPEGLVETDDGWQLALDPAAFAVGAPDMRGLLGAARCPVVLAAGEHDPMCHAGQLRALGAEPAILPGLGHNAHVQDPAALLMLLSRFS